MPSCRFSSKLARRLFYTSNRCDSLIPCVYLDAVLSEASFSSDRILLRQSSSISGPKVLCCQDPFSISQNLQNQRSAGSDLSEAWQEDAKKMQKAANIKGSKERSTKQAKHMKQSVLFHMGWLCQRPLCARDSKEILKRLGTGEALRLSGERWEVNELLESTTSKSCPHEG